MDHLEKGLPVETPHVMETPATDLDSGHEGLGQGELQVIRIREGSSVLRKLRDAEMWMDRKWKIEGMGAERIPEDKRQPPRLVNVSHSSVPVG